MQNLNLQVAAGKSLSCKFDLLIFTFAQVLWASYILHIPRYTKFGRTKTLPRENHLLLSLKENTREQHEF
jgi:hypothetical protein